MKLITVSAVQHPDYLGDKDYPHDIKPWCGCNGIKINSLVCENSKQAIDNAITILDKSTPLPIHAFTIKKL